jgi:hypothetical protein
MNLDKILNEQLEKLELELEIDQNNIAGVIPVGFTETNKIIKTFDDLEFETIESTFLENNILKNGIRARLMFDNGFGISVIKTCISYGHKQGLFEIAVLNSTTEELCYDTPITNNVIGNLTSHEVTYYMSKIQSLEIVYFNNNFKLSNYEKSIINAFINKNDLVKNLIKSNYVIYDELNDSYKFCRHIIK